MVELSDDTSGAEQREKWIALLKGGDFFSTFDHNDLNKLFDFGVIKKYAANEYIIKENTNNTSIFVILVGTASIIKNGGSAKMKKMITTVKTGECFGEMALWLDGLRTASVLATRDCYVFILSRDELEKMDLALQNKMLKRIAYAMALKITEDTDRLAKTPFF
jgi:CRP-like cAMP-binding protein